MTAKLVQLSILPLVLVVVALTTTPRHARRALRAPASSIERPEVSPSFFAGVAAPMSAVDLTSLRTPAAPAPRSQSAPFRVTVVAEWPDLGAASREAAELVTLLAGSARHFAAERAARARLLDASSPAPRSPAEERAFARAGLTSEVGIGWPGAATEASDAVVLVGRAVIVDGLKATKTGRRSHPLQLLLEARGARVLTTGDCGCAPRVVVDLTCDAKDEAAAARLVVALSHFAAVPLDYALRPPWHPLALSGGEARARATYARVAEAQVGAQLALSRLFDLEGGETPELETFVALMKDCDERMRAAISAAAEGEHDPVVLDELQRSLVGADVGELGPRDAAGRRLLAERMGALSEGERATSATCRARASGRRVELGGLTLPQASELVAPLAWLAASGCTDVRMAFVDGHTAAD